MDHRAEQGPSHMHPVPPKRGAPVRDAAAEPDVKKPVIVAHSAPPPAHSAPEMEDPPIPDDLSEISDDPDEILNRDDVRSST